MQEHILVTGGAGFIGSHIVDALIEEGNRVRVIDHLSPQVHPDGPPTYLHPRAEYIWGDLHDAALVDKALDTINVVIHQAAAVGVGQSMYEIRRYVTANVLGTATLLEGIVNHRHSIRKLLVASSMSVYGEGAYICPNTGELLRPQKRTMRQLEQRKWEMFCDNCRSALNPVPIKEDAALHPASVYAITKRDQEEMWLAVGRAYEIPTIAFRYFGVYGPRQTLSNPYAGLMAMFVARISNGKAPLVFEDGNQIRDFIHVSDVARANIRALHVPSDGCQVYNLSRGEPVRVIDVANILCTIINPAIGPEITNLYRKGDVRHCYADILRLRNELRYEPMVTLEQGLSELAEWAKGKATVDQIDRMRSELLSRQILV